MVNLAVDNCTSTHKKAQEKAAMRAFEALRQALESTAKHEEARTTAVLERYDTQALHENNHLLPTTLLVVWIVTDRTVSRVPACKLLGVPRNIAHDFGLAQQAHLNPSMSLYNEPGAE